MTRKYYLHRSINPVADYFGELGPEFEVSRLRYWLYRLAGFRYTIKKNGIVCSTEKARRKS